MGRHAFDVIFNFPFTSANAYPPDHQFLPLFLSLPIFVSAQVALATWTSLRLKHWGLFGLFYIHMTNSIHLQGLPSIDYIPFRNPHRLLFCFLGILGLLVGDLIIFIDIFFNCTILLVDYYC